MTYQLTALYHHPEDVDAFVELVRQRSERQLAEARKLAGDPADVPGARGISSRG